MAEFIICEAVASLPFHLFAYIPFWKRLRFSKPLSIFLLGSVDLLYILSCFLLLRFQAPQYLVLSFSLPVFGCFFFALVKEHPGKIAFLYFFTMDYTMCIRGMATFLNVYVLPPPRLSPNIQTTLISLALFFITLPLMFRYFIRTARLILEIEAPEVWKTIWMVPALMSLTIWFTTWTFRTLPLVSQLLSRLILMVCMLLIYHNVLQLVRQSQQQAISAFRLRHLEQIAQIQSSQYGLLQSRIQETRRARHDLKQHLRALQGYIDTGNLPALAQYVKTYGQSLPLESEHTFCQNTAVDAVLRFYADKAFSAKIPTDIFFSIGEATVIPEPEFCVLLGNLLENALENCSGSPDSRFIRVRASQTQGNAVTLTVDNSCLTPPVMEDDRLCSVKHDGFGVGTESVRLTSEKYHGTASFQWREGVFYTSVFLNP